jgi:hypothetical protein
VCDSGRQRTLTGRPRFVNVGDDHNEADAIRRAAGPATPMALRVAVTLGLPDRLLGDGAAAEQLAGELNQSPAALDLLLAHLHDTGRR